MATGIRRGAGIKDRNISESAGIQPHKLDLSYASESAFLTAKSNNDENSSSAEEGDFFYDSTANGLKVYNGTDWDTSVGAVPKIVAYQETFSYADMTDGGSTSGTFVLSHTIPAGAVYMQTTCHGITGFAGDSSATIQVGDGTDVDRYTTGTPSVFTTAAAGVSLGAASGTAWHTAAVASPTVTITSGTDFGAVNAGSITITLFYYRPV